MEITKRKKKRPLSTGVLFARYRDSLKPGSLGGLSPFAKANNSVKCAREVLEGDLGYTLPKPGRRRFHTLPVLVFGIDEQWRADLIEIINITKYNRGYRLYFLTVVDVFTTHAWVQPVKSKTRKAVTDVFKKILRASGGRKPINLLTDDGKEFYNNTFQNLIKRKGIHHFSTSGDTKTSVAERFNRTLTWGTIARTTVASRWPLKK